MTRPVFLVGSVPFNDTEEVFRRCGDIVGPVARRLPDGERGGWLPGDDFRRAAERVLRKNEELYRRLA